MRPPRAWIYGLLISGAITLAMALHSASGVTLDNIPFMKGVAAHVAAISAPIMATVVSGGSFVLFLMIVAQVLHLLYSMIELHHRELIRRHMRLALALLVFVGVSETTYYGAHLFDGSAANHHQTDQSA